MKKLADLPQYDIILVDTMNTAAIQHYSKLTLSYKGRPTGMLYGVMTVVHSLRRLYPQARLMFLWEGYKSLRKSRCDLYKANRKKTDNGFRAALEDVKEALSYLPVEEYVHSGLEADDLAGYFCNLYKDKRILLVSNDRDWWQFVEDGRVEVYTRNAVHTYKELELKLGYPPEKVALWKILKGDESDNVSGVPRFPTRLALKMVAKCDSYKDFLSYKFVGKDVTWRKTLKFYWDNIVERNAMLVLYHPEWVVKEHIIKTKRRYKKDELLTLLKKRGMQALVKRLFGEGV